MLGPGEPMLPAMIVYVCRTTLTETCCSLQLRLIVQSCCVAEVGHQLPYMLFGAAVNGSVVATRRPSMAAGCVGVESLVTRHLLVKKLAALQNAACKAGNKASKFRHAGVTGATNISC
jgi:hypothetical protein